MQTFSTPHVGAVNDLTARWCAAAGDGDFVVSGAGLWPLLALLAAAADGPARSELEAAVGLPAEAAQEAALRTLDILAEAVELSAALGIWVRGDLPLHDEWLSSLPVGTVDLLTGQPALDEWARRHTEGLIERFPLPVTPDTLLVLATALAAKTSWRFPFRDTVMSPEAGPWRGRRISALTRTDHDLRKVAVLDDERPVTRLIVAGKADLDVHLLIGSDSPAEVLATGLSALGGSVPYRTGLDAGPVAPGLTARQVFGYEQLDRLEVRLPPFAIRSEHDLMKQAELFGLRAASDRGRGHFPRISPTPLAIDTGAQDVLAKFDREGFEAAAVTALSMNVGAAPARPEQRHTTVLELDFDRPFGFLAVHRPSGMAVVAGWVANAADAPPPNPYPVPVPGFPR
ncbi:serpin family protein [Nocardia amikacinitolerans]|uniref:serpin family protein n=1 Tax=Nocardia amikacinitolerans TaxID=756689 RepID=UPI0020A382D5|nr:serpin family protein [Nocardia amikacinitolerans]MCP2288067.1 Serine protease inhibitor [Nocardia amikacinitolerans]